MSTITEPRMEAAMHFLAETDDRYADAKTGVERTEILRKRARSRVFLTTDGTVAERQAKAETDASVATADDAYIVALSAFEELRAKRQRAELVIDVWRSLEASRRRA
jgi:hypothetical protein